MKRIFLDANIFMRFLLQDDLKKANDIEKLFQAVESGKIDAETHAIIVAELVWVLSSVYKMPRDKISEYIALLFEMKHLTVKDGALVQYALDIFQKKNVDFIDAFSVGVAIRDGFSYVCSYDKDFDKIPGIKRIEPAELF